MSAQSDPNGMVRHNVKPIQLPQKPVAKAATKRQKIRTFLISFPESRICGLIRKKLSKISKKTLIIIVVIITITIISFSWYFSLAKRPTTQISTSNPTTSPIELEKGTPDYQTLLPADKSIADLGGWTRVSPPSSTPVFAYIDKINDAQINVSQQPLPDEFKTDTAQQVEQMAEASNATEKITVGDIIVHIGTSSEGPQSVIFSKNNLLVLIKSDVSIENDQWANYINNLR